MAVLCAAVLVSCEVDYDFNGKTLPRRVVVNALITPHEAFTIRLHWSGSYAEGADFAPVTAAGIRLFEDGEEVLACQADPSGTTATAFHAAAGRRYRLEVSVPGYGELSAETTVPGAPSAVLLPLMYKGWYRHFNLKELSVPADAKAVWIRGSRTSEYGVQALWGFYTSSVFVDQVNGSNDAYEADEKGSTVDFESFLRIPYENCTAAVPLRFSTDGGDPESTHLFRVIAASETYDRYMRSRYKQQLNTGEDAQENPFTEQVTVYSNIGNGFGIFAGYNEYKTSEL